MKAECEAVAAERDNLIELSNQLRAQESRLDCDKVQSKLSKKTSLDQSGIKATSALGDDQSFDFNVNDLAKSVWANAITLPNDALQKVRDNVCLIEVIFTHGSLNKKTLECPQFG